MASGCLAWAVRRWGVGRGAGWARDDSVFETDDEGGTEMTGFPNMSDTRRHKDRWLGWLLVVAFVLPVQAQTLVYRVSRVDVGDGTSIAPAVVVIEDGVIRAVGRDLPVPDGARLVELPEAVLTPGLIDANASITRYTMGVAPSVHPTAQTPPRPVWPWRWGDGEDGRDDATSPGAAAAGGCGCGRCAAVPRPHARRGSVSVPAHRGRGLSGLRGVGGDDHVARVGRDAVGDGERGVVRDRALHAWIDAVDLEAKDFARLAQYGVTTVFVTPDGGSVIGARGAILRTAGPESTRVIQGVDAIKAAIGRDPISRGGYNRMPSAGYVSVNTRRPNTRMGVAWVFRKAFFEAVAVARDEPLSGGADVPPDAAFGPLIGVLEGRVPLRIQARTQMDILTALRLTAEFGLDFTLEEGIEAYRCVPELQARAIPVIFGPIMIVPDGYRAYSREGFEPKLGAFTTLTAAGLQVALTANDLRDEEGLAAQALYAIRCGASYEQALAAVTSIPAKILGIEEQVGTVAVGKSADLLVWGGEPLRPSTPLQEVIIHGETVWQAK